MFVSLPAPRFGNGRSSSSCPQTFRLPEADTREAPGERERPAHDACPCNVHTDATERSEYGAKSLHPLEIPGKGP